ncbi:MAG: hypothetical protein GX094_06930 [Clostridiales bacterium]|nr:hypothetical protein [Clostridiales bacterium]
MFAKDIMQIGEKIEIIVNNTPDKASEVYYSMVQDIPSNEEIIITEPMSKGIPVALRIGSNIRVNFFRDRGQFYFFAEVVDRFKSGFIRLVRLKQTSQIFRLQRRNYFRLKTSIPVLFRIINDNDKTDNAEAYRGLIADISGGGLGLLTDEKLDPGIRIECNIKVEDMLDVTVQGIVVRTVEAGDNVTYVYKYHTGILFDKIHESKRREIIQFIFETQRKKIRKEKSRNLE